MTPAPSHRMRAPALAAWLPETRTTPSTWMALVIVSAEAGALSTSSAASTPTSLSMGCVVVLYMHDAFRVAMQTHGVYHTRCLIRLIVMPTLAVVVAPLATAQQPVKVARIGVLATGSRAVSGTPSFFEHFVDGLRALGYVEGQNLAFEYRYAEGHPDRLPALAAALVRLPVDIILCVL